MALKAGIPRKVLKDKTYRDSVGDQEMKSRDTERRTKDSRGTRKIAKEDKRSQLRSNQTLSQGVKYYPNKGSLSETPKLAKADVFWSRLSNNVLENDVTTVPSESGEKGEMGIEEQLMPNSNTVGEMSRSSIQAAAAAAAASQISFSPYSSGHRNVLRTRVNILERLSDR